MREGDGDVLTGGCVGCLGAVVCGWGDAERLFSLC